MHGSTAAQSDALEARKTELTIDGHTLTVGDVVSAARGEDAPRVVLSEDTVRRMLMSIELKGQVIEAGVPVYGVTSGFGDSNTRQISGKKAEDLQKNLIRFLSCGIGPTAPEDVIRATMIIRANCLARGYSAVRPEVVELLLECLNRDVLPPIPERGSVGASGDLVPLSYVASVVTGTGRALHEGVEKPSAEALAAVGLEPAVLEAKEGLALVNGTSFMSGFAATALHDAGELAFTADLCTALASQVLQGNPMHFAPFIFEQKPHSGTIRSAHTIRELLGDPEDRDPGVAQRDASLSEAGFRELEEPIQDRYSIRCAPHVTGVLRDTLDWATNWVDIEINSSNDNPLFDVGAGVVRNGGNFYGGHVGQAMDALKTAAASVADLLDRQLELVVDEKFNNGLTPNLIPRFEEDSWDAGMHHGFKGMQIAASGLTAEALKNTMPATSFSRSTEAHNQDKVSMATIAARDARTVVELVRQVAAIHLLALAQAADLRGTEVLSAPTKAAYDLVRSVSPTMEGDRPLEGDIQRVASLIATGALRSAAEAAVMAA
ncbi:aromatic amino acid ammonia-lyase [Streptomyces sp. UNOC14_S4]|uniref:aromatic amino acid ammonia-lyase n=1 Tax=Streptomyces sp. UNOC14_S4 TaxID=2872340 RepID=UPI001E31C4FE|nr:aromatic amino acid ammonia-lyase [Streptomyces sp. UNOC14_S4]MCC3771306.1 aromatic amino acid ammonia-lyase [Streptomyces sp. UNOC14_S4]